MIACLIGLGSNQGNREQRLREALRRLAAPDVSVVRHSAFLTSAPVGGPSGQHDFLNAAALLATTLEPRALLERLLGVERALGRLRTQRWAERPIDLDLLLYADAAIRTAELEIPHPRLATRRFVLAPAAEVAPDWIHPIFGLSIEQLVRNLDAGPNVAAIESFDEAASDLSRRWLEAAAGWAPRSDAADPNDAHPMGSPSGVMRRFAWTLIEGAPPECGVARKLIVLLGDWTRVASRTACDAWVAAVGTRTACPWLRLDASRPNESTDEFLAALEGMGGTA
ncbi:MAG: 2-amino-4-hydroxy-6-hydroxymethyldihydropteridine diphosphokinase [Planctomycetes bacterium]|nr:2-amino-4-hydroxy-6-hydroxymethyldihydropteridine diphosphokinase [Planctomycetota bacterium]